ncbi:putative ORFan [Tupanvirus deep ocean]|uniref:ORFan n=2 Tax=Tupanvirus TaxID=2094720 RepID=A0AC62A9R1_9VIRU|nr:putative ORFan [Tupanvirus deep ocean]QKU34407.1 putative ORFan [Tupanvirus deep ocean]
MYPLLLDNRLGFFYTMRHLYARLIYIVVLLFSIDFPIILDTHYKISSKKPINVASFFCGVVSLLTLLAYVGYLFFRHKKIIKHVKNHYIFEKIDATYYEIYPLKHATSAYKTYCGNTEYLNIYSYNYYDQPYIYVENQPVNLPFMIIGKTRKSWLILDSNYNNDMIIDADELNALHQKYNFNLATDKVFKYTKEFYLCIVNKIGYLGDSTDAITKTITLFYFDKHDWQFMIVGVLFALVAVFL